MSAAHRVQAQDRMKQRREFFFSLTVDRKRAQYDYRLSYDIFDLQNFNVIFS